MSESETMIQQAEVVPAAHPTAEELAEKMSHGLWRLRPSVVLRVEDDGAILFDADTDSVCVINPTGSALLQWRRDRICFDEWCAALQSHYKTADTTQIRVDVKKFLATISHFAESHDGDGN